MLINTSRNEEEFTEVNRPVIRVVDIDYRITLDKFTNGLSINKYSFGDESSSITITPSVSNLIIVK